MSADALRDKVWETQWVRFNWPVGTPPFDEPYKAYKIVSLDPGDTTGIVEAWIDVTRLGVRSMYLELWQYNWPDDIKIIHDILKTADIIVAEDYRVYSDNVKKNANTWKRPTALRVLGACELLSVISPECKYPVQVFSSAQTKEVSNSTLQQVWGELPLTKTGRSKAPYRHGIDAMRPLWLYLQKMQTQYIRNKSYVINLSGEVNE